MATISTYVSHEAILLTPEGFTQLRQDLERHGIQDERHGIQDEREIHLYPVHGHKSDKLLCKQYPIIEYEDLSFRARMERLVLWRIGSNHYKVYGKWCRFECFKGGFEPQEMENAADLRRKLDSSLESYWLFNLIHNKWLTTCRTIETRQKTERGTLHRFTLQT